jgi:hypothetical protein
VRVWQDFPSGRLETLPMYSLGRFQSTMSRKCLYSFHQNVLCSRLGFIWKLLLWSAVGEHYDYTFHLLFILPYIC